MSIRSADQITIVDITDAYSVILTSEAYTFVGNTTGVVSGSSCTTQAVAFCGSTQCQSVTVVGDDIVCPSGISASVTGSGTASPLITFTTTSTVTNACEATIPVSVDGITINKKFSFAVAKTGATGATGDAGKGIKSTTITYQKSSSGTSIPTGTWSTSIPSVSAGEYLWTRTTIEYTSGNPSISYSVGMMGATGAKGDKGDTGATGADAINMTITASNGTVFKNSSGSTVLTAHVFVGGVEQNITDAGVCGSYGSIKWYKGTTAVSTSKTLTVNASTVTGSQAYTAQLE